MRTISGASSTTSTVGTPVIVPAARERSASRAARLVGVLGRRLAVRLAVPALQHLVGHRRHTWSALVAPVALAPAVVAVAIHPVAARAVATMSAADNAAQDGEDD